MNDFRILAHLIRQHVPDTSLPGLLRRFPASIILASTITFIGIATSPLSKSQYEPILNRFGLDYDIISDTHFWHIMTPLFIQPSPGIGWKMVVLVVSACVALELLAGSVRLIVTFFVSDWASTVITSAVLAVLSRLGVYRATEAIHITDAGTSAAAVGALAAALTLLLPPRLAGIAYGILFAAVITDATINANDFGPAVVHIVAILVGGALGRYLWRPQLYHAIRHGHSFRMGGVSNLSDIPRG
ncbi:MAG: hypothetical protein ACR2OU_03020 [Thermomicrobiales bacterium]